ncbi:hypothetical protein OB08_15130 [Microbacterium sp. HJ5]
MWSDVAGYPKTVDGVTISWQTAASTTSPFGGEELIDPLPVLRVELVNGSSEPRHFGLGTDLSTQGVVDHLWTTEAWGLFDEVLSGIESSFWLTLGPGESLSVHGGDAAMWSNPLPSWSGHTMRVFSLSEPPVDPAVPTVTTFDSYVVPGRYVAAHLDDVDLDHVSEIIGTRATVNSGGSPELFPGLSASVAASGLTPGEQLELWIAPDLDYFYFALLGGGLPVSALKVGEGTVGAGGTLAATFTLPSDLAYGSYQLVAGVRGERYWPAGSYGDFLVTTPPNAVTQSTPAGVATGFDLGPTDATVTLPAGSTGGTTTATVSGTGPAADGFQLAGDPPLYYHLSTTASFTGSATVCFDYDTANLPGDPPRLYHFDTALNRWDDITTTRVPGRVCGATTSFSPFALGYGDEFDFTGFFDPVSMTGPNVAKAGQAVPVSFSLDGDQGLEVVTSARFVVEGTVANPVGELLDAATAGHSGLQYDAVTDRYTYVWKTDKAWAKKTGQFVLTLSDGTTHAFEVSFKK